MGRRDRGAHQQGPFAGVREPDNAGLEVWGATLVPVVDEEAWAAQNDASLLLEWAGELVERWDARMLMDDPAAARPSKRPRSSSATAASAAPGEPDEAALDAERYRDLDPSRENELAEHGRLRWLGPLRCSPLPSPPRAGLGPQQQQQQQQHRAAIPFDYGSSMAEQQHEQDQMLLGSSGAMGTGSYHAVGFSYGQQALGEALAPVGQDLQPAAQAAAAALPTPGPDEPPFAPRFAIPERLASAALPATERHYRVMEQTAGFVRQGGGQLEVLLRVKQAGSPLFAFLVPSDPLHAFYRWLVDTPPETRLLVDAAPGAAAAELAKATPVEGPAEVAAVQNLQQPDAEQQQQEQQREQQQEQQHMEIDSLALLQVYNDDWEEAEAEAEAEADDNAAGTEQQAEQQKQEDEHVATTTSLSCEMAAAAKTSEPAPVAEPATEEEAAEAEPSPDQIAIMQKLIAFVQKNGARFEAVVRRREQSNPRFAFLRPGQAHHRTYRRLLAEALGGEAPADALLLEAQAAAASVKDPLAPVQMGWLRKLHPPLATIIAAPVPATAAAAGGKSKLDEEEQEQKKVERKVPPGADPAAFAKAVAAAQAAAEALARKATAAKPPEAQATAAATAAASAAAACELPPWTRNKQQQDVATAAAVAATIILKKNPSAAAKFLELRKAAAAAEDEAAAAAAAAAAEEEARRRQAAAEEEARQLEAAAAAAAAEEEARQRQAEELKKAERLRRARELLARQQHAVAEAEARQRQAAAEAAARQRQQAITTHRQAFLGESASESAAAAAAAPPLPQLPSVEALALSLRLRRSQGSANSLPGLSSGSGQTEAEPAASAGTAAAPPARPSSRPATALVSHRAALAAAAAGDGDEAWLPGEAAQHMASIRARKAAAKAASQSASPSHSRPGSVTAAPAVGGGERERSSAAAEAPEQEAQAAAPPDPVLLAKIRARLQGLK